MLDDASVMMVLMIDSPCPLGSAIVGLSIDVFVGHGLH